MTWYGLFKGEIGVLIPIRNNYIMDYIDVFTTIVWLVKKIIWKEMWLSLGLILLFFNMFSRYLDCNKYIPMPNPYFLITIQQYNNEIFC